MALKSKTISNLLLCTALSCGGFYAYAQDDTTEQATTRTLPGVTVTAQRRAQSQQDVPIAITTVTAESLGEAGIDSTLDLQLVTPGLNVGTQLSGAVPFIRGIGTETTAAGQDSGVALYVDDVYLSSTVGSIMTLPNIERIEVLKGPQGTLFGRNATGGLLHVVTKTPSADGENQVELSYGNFNTFGASAYVTGGLSENIAADLSVYYKDQGEGYGTNLATGNDTNETDELMLRSKWLFNLGADTDFQLSLDYAETDTSQGPAQRLIDGALGIEGALIFGGCLAGAADPTAPTPAELGACAAAGAAGASQFTGDFHDTDSSVDAYAEIEQWGLSGIFDHKFGDIDFTSVTAYRETDATQFLAQQNTPFPGFLDVLLTQFTNTFTQEFRLSSSADNVDWIAGAYFLSEESGYEPTRISGVALSPLDTLTDLNQQDTTSWALFAQADYNLSEDTTLTAGLRYTEDEREASGTTFGSVGGVTAASITYSDATTFDELTYRLSLSHDFSDSMMGYISYNRGFKAGLYNLNVLNPVTGLGPVIEPEILDAYEIGFKSELWDNRVRLNASAFYYDYQDLQVSISTPGGNTVLNAAEATMSGGEVELLAAVTNNLTLNAGLSLLDTEYETFANGPSLSPTGFGANVQIAADLAGNEVPRSPGSTFSFGASHEFDTEMGSINSSINYYYNDGFFWQSDNRLEQDSYSLINAQITWSDPSDSIYVGLYGRNLGDEEYSNWNLASELGDFISAAAPQTYGVKVGKKF